MTNPQALKEALERYGKHDGLCAIVGGYGYCTCGLDEVLTSPSTTVATAVTQGDARGIIEACEAACQQIANESKLVSDSDEARIQHQGIQAGARACVALIRAKAPEIIAALPAQDGDDLRHKFWMVICHASGGRLAKPEDVDRSINDICVQITQKVNDAYEAGKAAALPKAGEVEPVAYRYVHLDYAGRKVSRYGDHPERVNGHDPIEAHPLYATPPSVIPAAAVEDDLTAVYLAGKHDGRKEAEGLTERYRAALLQIAHIANVLLNENAEALTVTVEAHIESIKALATPEQR